ncbi:MAG TPA: molybdenum cofactor biosynthesis protein B [Candidatus Binatia bacterium]|nr:molybdenum cofactor biosynthesis protein B [Candidatus Binatia bacterium]
MSAHHTERGRSLACAIVTVSDTRTRDTDSSGARIRELLEADGHRVAAYAILPDEPEIVRTRLVELVADSLEVAIVNGGTGLAPRDTTYEAVVGMLDKRLDGFGELFRALSFAEIGPAAMLSRAVAGVAGRTIIASLPGSTPAVDLAMRKLLLPVIGHAVQLLRG